MHGKTKAGVFLFAMLLLALAGPTRAATIGAGDPGTLAQRPNTGINSDGYFPPGVDPICGVEIYVHGSKPVNFYTGARNPWGAPVITEYPAPGSGYWKVTFGDPVHGPCFSRNDPIFKECGVFKGLHFGFFTDDPVVEFLDPTVWREVNIPCWYYGPNGKVPCGGLTSHSTTATPAGQLQILNDNAQAFAIQNARIAVAPDLVPINALNPCDLANLNWQTLQLADSLLPGTSSDQPGTLNVTIPDSIRGQTGWAVVSYDVTDLETGEVLTTSTLEFALQ